MNGRRGHQWSGPTAISFWEGCPEGRYPFFDFSQSGARPEGKAPDALASFAMIYAARTQSDYDKLAKSKREPKNKL